MKNKKSIMAVSAMLILIYHLWINITTSSIEVYLRQLCVTGVDLFFFVSAYSIASRKDINYKNFISNRFKNIYFKFFIFSIIGAFYLKWSLEKFFKTIIGIQLIERGGGSFLWFLPGVMLVYFILPLYKKIDEKYPKIVPILAIITYLLSSISLSLFTNIKALFILLNRMPIILLGYYFAKYKIIEKLSKNKSIYFLVLIITLISGILISYYGYINHFRVEWLRDIIYIVLIPLNIGLILLLNKINENKAIKLLSSITLELYALQMIFGFKIANYIYKMINLKLLSNIITICVLILFSLIVNYIFKKVPKLVKKN